ncbi:ribonuclease H-like domain-containing protein [Tanacetum coccineum]
MTCPDSTLTPTPLSEKLSLVTHHHLLTRVPVKLDLDDWNYGSWEFFFDQLCSSYDVEKYIHSPSTESSPSSSAPLTPEEIKVDKIVLSWIFITLSDSLQAWIVVARPKSAREALGLISDIVKDNKRSRTNALKTELRNIKLGDQSMESYFQNFDSIVNILTSLDAHVNDEDVVHYALEGLSDTYNQVCGYMHWKDTFSRSQDGNNRRSSSTPQVKSWKPCFNFAKRNCRFGDSCRYVHDANARVGPSNSIHPTVSNPASNPSPPVAFHTIPLTYPSPPSGPTPTYPHGFLPQVQPLAHVPNYYVPIGPSTVAAYSPQSIPMPPGYSALG